MKTVKFFTDTETTGLSDKLDQILAYSVVLEAPGGQTVSEMEQHIFLKKNVMPNASALLVNKINPFTSKWKQESIHEFLAYQHLAGLAKKHQDENQRLILIAYNAPFDRKMYKEMFARCGGDFDRDFPLFWDPYPTARKLIEAGLIETPTIQATYSKSYQSAKLEHVFVALGNDSSMFKAHTALDDTKMLQVAAHGIYFLAVGKKLEDMMANPENFLVGQNVHVVMDENNTGLQKRHYRILLNDQANHRLLVVDEEMTKNQTPESVVHWLSYFEIHDELPLEKHPVQRLETFVTQHQQTIAEVVAVILSKKEKPAVKKVDFDQVERLADLLVKADDPKKIIESLTDDEKALVKAAENLSYAKYNDGWTYKTEGPDYMTKVRQLDLTETLVVQLDPVGSFILLQNGEIVLTTEKKTELQEKILALSGLTKEDSDYKLMVKKIPSTNDFKNDKHPKDILEEYQDKKGEVFNSSSKENKDILSDLLLFYKEQSPAYFKDITLPSFKLDLGGLLKKK